MDLNHRPPGPGNRGVSESGPRANNEYEARKKLTSAPGLLVLFCHVQFFAEHFSSPVRYRLGGLTQLAADEVRHHPEAAAMHCVVVHEQFISMFRNFRE